MNNEIKEFLASHAFAVVGASNNRNKFGNKVLRAYIQRNLKVYPVNNKEKIIEGLLCVNSVIDLPYEVQSISIVTPPKITEQIVEDAAKKGIKHIWMQPGAENDTVITKCKQYGIQVIGDGHTCILVTLGFHE